MARTKSETGAYMSEYDQEVEKRLKALEAEAHKKPTGATQAKVDARLNALEEKVNSKSESTPSGGLEERVEYLEGKLDQLIKLLKGSSNLNLEKRSGGTL